MKTNVVVSDIGDVFFQTHWGQMNRILGSEVGVTIFPKEGGRYRFYRDLQRGALSPQQYFERLAVQAGKKIAPSVLESAYRAAYVQSTLVNNEMRQLAEYLRKNVTFVGVSTTNVMHAEINKQRGIFENFDRIHLSHEVGLLEEKFLSYVAERELTSGGNALYIDDSLENCMRATRIGFVSLRFTNVKRLQKVIQELEFVRK